uniref:Uncharacterized protein n=1 Tax=Anguilla anguilla TaxID=7936 RepID=A0A0E9XHQ8_ANGAN
MFLSGFHLQCEIMHQHMLLPKTLWGLS